MIVAEPHPYETERTSALRALEILDTEREAVFDGVAELVSLICHTPIALISLIDEHRQWFKAAKGLDANETSRDIAFCAHAILQSEMLVVEDALRDERFHDNPLVAGEPQIRFYAGQPLVTSSGLPLGTLCTIDRVPRTLTLGQQRALTILAHQVVAHFETRAALSTLQKAKDATQGQPESLQRWLSIVAHDLRAPFTSVIGLTELLNEDIFTMDRGEISACLADLGRAARSGHQMLENLLELALIRAGINHLSPQPVHLRNLFTKLASMVVGLVVPKQLELVIDCDVTLTVMADPRLLSSMLQNLLTNAIKFTASGGKIRLSAARDLEGLTASVQDTGVGIRSDVVERLNAGRRVENSRGTTGESGSGWGLQLCREFCELCNASLTFNSTLGIGTTATIRFTLSGSAR